MLNAIKQAAMDAVGASNPVAILFGTVTKANPLEVNVEQRFTLTADFLMVPERLVHYEVDLTHTHSYEDDSLQKTTEAALSPLVIRRGLEKGDKVIMLRVQGGQKYVILDRVVSA